MKICYHTIRWGWENASRILPKVLEEISIAGFEAVEFNDIDVVPYLKDPDGFVHMVANYGLKFVGLVTYSVRPLLLGRLDPYRLYAMRQIGKFIRFAGDTGCEIFVLAAPMTGSARAGIDEAEYIRFANSLNNIGKECKKYGMKASYHPKANSIGSTIPQIRRLLDLTDPELVNLTLDTGHLSIAGLDPVEVITTFSDRLNHVHIKDVKGGIFAELGEGTDIDIPAVMKLLHSIDYSGWMTIEDEVLVCPPPLSLIGYSQRKPLETARNSMTYMERILSAL
jgi:inosose dehydratase